MMNKVLIFGNSASGKSTLALKLASQYKLAHLDLDTIAWQASKSPTRNRYLKVPRRSLNLYKPTKPG